MEKDSSVAETLTFDQIRDLLRGTPFKVLDCRRRGLLKLGTALAVFMAYWMHENGLDEAWPSTETIAKEVGLKERQVQRLRRKLMNRGWIVQEGGYASDHYYTSTPGARQVPVYRVDDPSKNVKNDVGVRDSEISNNAGKKNSKNVKNVQKAGVSKMTPKDSPSLSGSGSGSTSASKSGSASVIDTPLRGGKAGPSPDRTETETADPNLDSEPCTQKQKSRPVFLGGEAAPSPSSAAPLPEPKYKVDKSGKLKLAPDGTPFPAHFDSCAGGNAARIAWRYYHTPKEQRVEDGTDKLRLFDYLCHGVSDDELAPPCLNLPHRKLDMYYYCPDCLPWTDYDREQAAKQKAAAEQFRKDLLDTNPESIAARRKKFEEADRKRQEWMAAMERLDKDPASAFGPVAAAMNSKIKT
jgi:hypothetical protein